MSFTKKSITENKKTLTKNKQLIYSLYLRVRRFLCNFLARVLDMCDISINEPGSISKIK